MEMIRAVDRVELRKNGHKLISINTDHPIPGIIGISSQPVTSVIEFHLLDPDYVTVEIFDDAQ